MWTRLSGRVVVGMLVGALALGAAACSDDDDGGSVAGDGTDSTTSTDKTDADTSGCDYEAVASSTDMEAKPAITIPDCDPPTELVQFDLVEGDGAEVPEGAGVTAHYVGVGWDSKTEFDSSWSRGEPTSFPLTGVIAGWQQGIPGMKVGGRRVLVIPGALAYGPAGRAPSIGPDETLVFVVDITAIT